jgi:lipopolysaccharide export system protein LptA
MAKIRIDGTRTQTIRTILLATFAAVAVVLLGALGLRQLKSHGFHFDLPGKLGVDITQTANGYTFSQSQGGHTIFTIHASKIVEFKNNRADLHDVSITLYGPEGSHRADHISGKEFVYDKDSGKVTAKGAVEIDLSSPASTTGSNGTPAPDNIHVQTSDLTFDQKSGEAQTSQPLAFALPRAQGTSVGGDYNAKTGVLILQSAVVLNADQNGNPATIHAEHAQLLRDSHIAYLLQATSDYEGGHNSADQAILHFRPDGSIVHMDAQGHVHMVTADGAELYSTNATADFDAHSQPVDARASGGVNFVSDTPASTMHGNATNGAIVFVNGPDGKASVRHAVFNNAVSFVLQQNSLGGDPRGSATREMTASQLSIDFAPGPGNKSIAQKAIARGGAMVSLHDLPYGAPQKQTVIHGQQLIALLRDGHELKQLDGSGGTNVQEIAADGASQTSTGDTLHATFLPTPAVHIPHPPMPAGGPGSSAESASIDTAVQQGHVTMVAKPAFQAKQADGTPQQPLYADAALGVYHSVNQTLSLTGDGKTQPRVHNATLSLAATTIDYHRETGDAVAHGDVRSTYLQAPAKSSAGQATPAAVSVATHAPGLGGGGAVHVVAASAQMTRASNIAIFQGEPGTLARMWQGANSVTAPVLELGKQQGSLDAHGDPGRTGAGQQVHAVFSQKPATAAAPRGLAGGVTRVQSETLFYSDTTRRGDFHGSVVAQQPDGTVHADDAQVFLSEAPAGQPSALERMIATGNVMLAQPGRRGTGDKLVYTAADGNYILTGTLNKPPHATDTQHGTTTGAALVFRGGDDSVEVMSNDAEGNTRRTVTDTRTPK